MTFECACLGLQRGSTAMWIPSLCNTSGDGCCCRGKNVLDWNCFNNRESKAVRIQQPKLAHGSVTRHWTVKPPTWKPNHNALVKLDNPLVQSPKPRGQNWNVSLLTSALTSLDIGFKRMTVLLYVWSRLVNLQHLYPKWGFCGILKNMGLGFFFIEMTVWAWFKQRWTYWVDHYWSNPLVPLAPYFVFCQASDKGRFWYPAVWETSTIELWSLPLPGVEFLSLQCCFYQSIWIAHPTLFPHGVLLPWWEQAEVLLFLLANNAMVYWAPEVLSLQQVHPKQMHLFLIV